MKQSILFMILSLLNLFLTGWVLTALYDAYSQFAVIIKEDPALPWEVTISTWPFFFLIIYAVILVFFYRHKKKQNENLSWLFPMQFSEKDERERAISGEAFRKAYIATWVSAPIAAAALVFYPLFEDQFRYFPIIIILLIPMVQIVTYFFHIRKI
ncbi:hypothetical protein J14TS2_13890 [Bacillus sp. J14TS2]|uniref:hypothetical protein n=1 Tax=Bacillus sp. J14TS2 TaxID=2807188 RepID=UPI001B0934E3|nr:hypothetical protein [Bacillus sp. J14TS2]GIN70914.1 hypothetical protein J14TS2_13890 [Bacillus sp. J14TS2]